MAEGFEKIEISEMDNEGPGDQMYTSDYAQVIFHDIAESYPVDVNVSCKYTVTSLLQPTKRDWIGVYKVGWTSSKEHVYYEWAPLPNDYEDEKQYDGKINFRASTLPKEDGEFYQFCYVTSAGHVRGASTPFQFKHPSADDFVEIEDLDDNIMVIKSKKTALEDQLGNVTKEREVLVKNKERLETERESLLSKLVLTEKKVQQEKASQESAKKELKVYKTKVEQLNNEAKDMLVVHDGFRGKIATLSEEKMAMSKLLEEKDSYIRSTQKKIKSLINEKDSFMGKNKMLEEEKDLYKNHFTSSESTLQGHIKEIENLKQLLQAEEVCSGDLKVNIAELQTEIEELKSTCATHERAIVVEQEKVQEVEEELRSSADRIAALEECKVSLGKELETMTLTYKEVSDKWEQSKEEAHSLQKKVTLLEEVNEKQTVHMGEQIQELNHKLKTKVQQNEELSEESERIKAKLQQMSLLKREHEEGPLFALQMAHENLKARLQKSERDRKDMEKDVAELVRRKNAFESQEQDMKREIEDLKERLLMGQEEYKEKYIECKKVYQELKKLQRQVGSRRNSESPEKQVQTEKNESECYTQTKLSTGNKHTETDKKVEAEQMTQTAVKVEKETHTQTSVAEAESHTQTTKIEGAEQQTQTSVNEESRATQAEQTEPEIEFADLTNPELQMQLDDLGRELENRTVKKQKYKEQYQKEKEKCAYLQRHYFEELEKKDKEISVLQEIMAEKQNKINFLEQTVEDKNRQLDWFKGQPKETIVYPPQQAQHPRPCPPPTATPVHYQVPQSYIYPPAEVGNHPSTVSYPPQGTSVIQCSPYPVFYDRQPLLVYTGVPQGSSNTPVARGTTDINKQQKTDDQTEIQNDEVTSTSNVEDLDPLKNEAKVSTASSLPEEHLLPAPLIPEETVECKVTKVMCYMNRQRDGTPTIEIPQDESIERDAERMNDIFGGDENPITPEIPEVSSPTNTPPSAPVLPHENDESEDRFFDAPETKECPICHMTFPLQTEETVLSEHVDQHFTVTKDCPMCQKRFSSDTEHTVFEEHVQKHFNEHGEGMEV